MVSCLIILVTHFSPHFRLQLAIIYHHHLINYHPSPSWRLSLEANTHHCHPCPSLHHRRKRLLLRTHDNGRSASLHYLPSCPQQLIATFHSNPTAILHIYYSLLQAYIGCCPLDSFLSFSPPVHMCVVFYLTSQLSASLGPCNHSQQPAHSLNHSSIYGTLTYISPALLLLFETQEVVFPTALPSPII